MDDASDLDRDVDDSMRLFERAHVGGSVPLTPTRPSRVLMVLDGSDQDEASTDAAITLREKFNTETLVLDARDEGKSGGSSPASEDVVRRVSGSRVISGDEGEPYEAILQALATHSVDLVIVPCPFGRSFEKIGADSVGTVVDVLLSRCSQPFLIVRNPEQRLSDCVARVSVLTSSECDVEARAASWAFGLSAKSGVVSLNLVVEKENFENIRSVMEAMTPDQEFDVAKLTDVLQQTHQSLHASMSKTASDLGIEYKLLPQAGEVAPPNLMSEPIRQLIVLPLEVDDRFTQGFVIDRIRRSPHPVLVVPGHVPPNS